MPPAKALIVLQENSGRIPLDMELPDDLRRQVEALLDGLTERFENWKMGLQAEGRYDAVHLLTDHACTRADLLDALVAEAGRASRVDLVVLGHGADGELMLKAGPNLTGGAGGDDPLAAARRAGPGG